MLVIPSRTVTNMTKRPHQIVKSPKPHTEPMPMHNTWNFHSSYCFQMTTNVFSRLAVWLVKRLMDVADQLAQTQTSFRSGSKHCSSTYGYTRPLSPIKHRLAWRIRASFQVSVEHSSHFPPTRAHKFRSFCLSVVCLNSSSSATITTASIFYPFRTNCYHARSSHGRPVGCSRCTRCGSAS